MSSTKKHAICLPARVRPFSYARAHPINLCAVIPFLCSRRGSPPRANRAARGGALWVADQWVGDGARVHSPRRGRRRGQASRRCCLISRIELTHGRRCAARAARRRASGRCAWRGCFLRTFGRTPGGQPGGCAARRQRSCGRSLACRAERCREFEQCDLPGGSHAEIARDESRHACRGARCVGVECVIYFLYLSVCLPYDIVTRSV